jgi:hypothetical protein
LQELERVEDALETATTPRLSEGEEFFEGQELERQKTLAVSLEKCTERMPDNVDVGCFNNALDAIHDGQTLDAFKRKLRMCRQDSIVFKSESIFEDGAETYPLVQVWASSLRLHLPIADQLLAKFRKSQYGLRPGTVGTHKGLEAGAASEALTAATGANKAYQMASLHIMAFDKSLAKAVFVNTAVKGGSSLAYTGTNPDFPESVKITSESNDHYLLPTFDDGDQGFKIYNHLSKDAKAGLVEGIFSTDHKGYTDTVFSCYRKGCGGRARSHTAVKDKEVFTTRLPINYVLPKKDENGKYVLPTDANEVHTFFIDCWMLNPKYKQGNTPSPKATYELMQPWGEGGNGCVEAQQQLRGALSFASEANANMGEDQKERLDTFDQILGIVAPILASPTVATLASGADYKASGGEIGDKLNWGTTSQEAGKISKKGEVEEGDMVANVALSDMTNDVSANANALVDLSDRIDEDDEKNPNWDVLKSVKPELKLGISLATKTVGCALGIAAAPVTGGFSAAVGCGALIIGGAQEVITYMKSQIRHAPKEPAFMADLQWVENYMKVLKDVEKRASDAMERIRDGALKKFEFSSVTLTSMRKVVCVIGAMNAHWDEVKKTFSVNEAEQAESAAAEKAAEETMKKMVDYLDKAIQLEQMRMLVILGVDSKELKASHELEKDEEADEDREVLRQWSQIGRGKHLAIAGPDEERTQSVEVQGP